METKCKIRECCSSHRCEIVGIIFLALATVLTLITLNGMGIFGLFIVGVLMCCHKHMGCRKCNCECCASDDSECEPEKKVTSKKET